MAHPLDGVRLKIVRAEKHLHEVTASLARIEEKGTCRLIPEHDQDSGLWFQRIHLEPKPQPEMSVIIGDFLFGIRSALDHLVWQLVKINGQEPSTVNMFPIAPKPYDFRKAIKYGRLRGVAEGPCALINSLQPYYAGNESLKWLDSLHNTDKHRTLNFITVVADSASLAWIKGSNPTARFSFAGEELRDNAIFGGTGLPVNEPWFDAVFPQFAGHVSEMTVEGEATLLVAFYKTAASLLDGFRVGVTLQSILEFVRYTVVPTFDPFFD